MLFNLVLLKILFYHACFSFSLIIGWYFLIPAVIRQIFNPIAGTLIPLHVRHTTLNRRQLDVEIMLLRQCPNFDNFSRPFPAHFRCNFTYGKIQVVSTYFFDVTFMVK